MIDEVDLRSQNAEKSLSVRAEGLWEPIPRLTVELSTAHGSEAYGQDYITCRWS